VLSSSPPSFPPANDDDSDALWYQYRCSVIPVPVLGDTSTGARWYQYRCSVIPVPLWNVVWYYLGNSLTTPFQIISKCSSSVLTINNKIIDCKHATADFWNHFIRHLKTYKSRKGLLTIKVKWNWTDNKELQKNGYPVTEIVPTFEQDSHTRVEWVRQQLTTDVGYGLYTAPAPTWTEAPRCRASRWGSTEHTLQNSYSFSICNSNNVTERRDWKFTVI